MPRATSRFQFEWKVFDWAYHLSDIMSVENHCFLMVLDPEGVVRQLLIGEDELNYDREVWGPLMESGGCWLFYHPFDGPVYTYIAWTGIARDTLERLMGERFEQTDFVELRVLGSPHAESESMDFPSSWNVMF